MVFAAAMYFILIKPQRKKDQENDAMRKSLKVGDEIVTIGGVCGKVVKTKEDSIIIQVGADKTKLEFKRWAVSAVTKKAEGRFRDEDAPVEEKKARPKRLGRKAESMEEEAQALVENVDENVEAVDTEIEETK